MILSTPNYIITYRAINPRGEWEDGTILSPNDDIVPTLERDGYRKVEILGVRES